MENLKNNAMLTDQEGIENEDFELEIDVNDDLEIDVDDELDIDLNWDEEVEEVTNKEPQEEENLDLEIDSDWGVDEGEEKTKVQKGEPQGEINLDDFVSLTGESKQRSKGGVKGGLSIVNAKTGQRVSLCADIWTHLGEPQELQFRAGEKQLLISPVMNSNDAVWKLPDNAEKAILYRAGLVNSLTEAYQLDFSTRSSLSFTEYKKLYHQGYPIVLIAMH